MLIYDNNFPAVLQAMCIGPDPTFLENNTTNCEFVSAFPHEVDLMYDWKNLKKSSEPMRSLRDFSKKLIMYGRDLDVATIKFFVHKVNVFPEYYSNIVKEEISNSFDIAKDITVDDDDYDDGSVPPEYTYTTFGQSPDNDKKFLNKLAAMLKGCNAPCNYFKPTSDSIGTLFDFGLAMSDGSHSFVDIGKDILHAPLNLPLALYNQISPQFRSEFTKLKTASTALVKNGVAPFFSKDDAKRVEKQLASGVSPDMVGETLPMAGDTKTYQTVSQVHSELLSKVKEKLGDCFRMFDHMQKYNAYDPTMNSAYAKRKYMGIKNSNVTSLIDILGSQAPGKYSTENTYIKALNAQPSVENRKFTDTVKPPKYDSYDSPSGAGAAVVTGGSAGGVNPVTATGSNAGANVTAGAGLENTPSTGKVYQYDFGEVKLTSYGERGDLTPDTGSEIGLGTRGMIVPLKTIAVCPEVLPKTGSGIVKYGDILIIQCTSKSGETFIERRQVADVSAPGLLTKGQAIKGVNYKFLIDEFVPDKSYKSRLAGRSAELKLSIQVADTAQPIPKWNPQEASKFAAMFVSKTDWVRVKHYAKSPKSDYHNYYVKMDSEYRKFCTWNDGDALNENWLTKWAKVPQPWTT